MHVKGQRSTLPMRFNKGRLLCISFLGIASVLVCGGCGTTGSAGDPDFSIEATPSSKKVSRGGNSQKHTFGITGNLSGKLFPGGKAPIDLVLNNPFNFQIKVKNLTVALRAKTISPGCSGDRNFKVQQYSVSYPLKLPKGSHHLG